MPQVDRKARLRIPPQPIPKQKPEERVHNWREVALGFSPDSAVIEAQRCIQCPAAPCIRACPVENDIPGALWRLEQGDFTGAADVFRETSVMPEVCSRICPQERLCEGSCVVGKNNLPVAIGKLEAFAADYQRRREGFPLPEVAPATGRRVAVVGAGPAGLAVAELLRCQGHAITVFDAWPRAGGILVYGVPSFKLDKGIVSAKVAWLEGLGVEFVLNTWVGRDVTLDDLFARGYDAVFLGHGAGVGSRLGIAGEELAGVSLATDFLVRGNLAPDLLPPELRQPLTVGRRVAVVGGGDTAMDCVRTAVRLGPEEVTCLYRRTEAEMPGRAEERGHAREEGVQFHYLTLPLRYLGDETGHVRAVECQRMELGEPDASGRRRPVPVPGSEFLLEVDDVVLAVGYGGDEEFGQAAGVETHHHGLVVVDGPAGQTSRHAVWAAGDNVRGADLVVTALADARRAAGAIDQFLRSL